MLKRFFDIVMSFVGLAFLSPFFLFIALWIKADSRGSIFYKQIRVGLRGKNFKIYKFRTMTQNADRQGGSLTVGKDNRITRSGVFLRKYKIDELSQLINVFFGDMSLVGPRPEVPEYIEYYSIEARNIILSVRPGITDFASINFKNENETLAKSSNPQESYITEIMPIKEKYYLNYVEQQTFFLDLKIIFFTIVAIFSN